MKKIDPNMERKELTSLAVQIVNEIFQKGDRLQDTYIREDEKVMCNADKRYIYFSGPLYLKEGFVDAQMINRLQGGARMLSVGAGEGHLERLLNLGFHVPKSRIAVTDYPSIHPRLNGSGFKKYVFDMTKEWSEFKGKFDYVLFPESLGVAILNLSTEEEPFRFYTDIESITKICEEGRFNELTDSDIDFFIGLIEEDIPVAKKRYEILVNALKVLNSNGEIRMSTGIEKMFQKAYAQLRLKKDGANVSYPQTIYSKQLFIRLE